MKWLFILAALFATTPDPANAAALVGLLTGPGTLTIAGLAVNSLGFRLLSTVALGALARALQPKPKQSGIRTEYTTGGGTNPQTFLIGRYSTAGNAIAPNYYSGSSGKTPNAYLTQVIDFGDVPGIALSRVIINEEYVTLDTVAHADYGFPVLEFRNGSGTDYAWVKFYDGSQTVADPFMLATFANDPDFPWGADMVGTGMPYGLFTFRVNRDLWTQEPKIRCEFDGIPLYDPRFDTSVGGSGAQRWADPATWARTNNVQVQKYNILRGITLPDGSIWGGEAAEEDVPLSNWFAAMNVCDVAADGETEPQYQAGLEIAVDDEPAAILEELDKACSGQTVEIGGVWKTRTGGPGVPIYYFTDDDIIVTKEQGFDPFPGLEASFNGVQATFPDPDNLWITKDAPPRYNAAYEAEDQGRRLVAALQLPAVSSPAQVQRLMQAYIKEERRFRRHNVVLPPDAAILEPLDAASWTSLRNNYVNKIFEVSQLEDHMSNCNQGLALRERDGGDYVWVSGDLLPTSVAPTGRTYPSAQNVTGYVVAPSTVQSDSGSGLTPAIKQLWDPDIDDVESLIYAVRIKSTAVVVSRGLVPDFSDGEFKVTEGIHSGTTYEIRSKYRSRSDRAMSWTPWITVSTAVDHILNNPSATGERIEYLHDRIKVFDAAGQVRLIMGKLV